MGSQGVEDAALFDGLYQFAYVASELDHTVERLKAFGVREFKVEREIVRKGGSGTIRNSAKAWIGPVMLEIIEPWRDRPSIYDASMPEGATAFPHHLGCDIADDAAWAKVNDTVRRQDLKVVSAGAVPAVLNYSYVDTRAALGLMLEHVQLLDRRFYDSTPRNAVGGTRPGLLDDAFLLGFVSRDLDIAKAAFATAGRLGSFFDVAAPGGGPVRRRAYARLGRHVLELVEPDESVTSSYRDMLPPSGPGARLHHLGMRLKSGAEAGAVENAAASLGLARQPAEDICGMNTLMIDARADLGHLLAYVEIPTGASPPPCFLESA